MGGLVSQQTLELIRTASDIVEVIGSYPLTKRAGNFIALPFHKEGPASTSTPSESSLLRLPQGATCSGSSRNREDFLGHRRLAERARIPLDFARATSDPVPGETPAIHEAICQRWQAALAGEAAGQQAREYLA
jgi:hypothetical protein